MAQAEIKAKISADGQQAKDELLAIQKNINNLVKDMFKLEKAGDMQGMLDSWQRAKGLVSTLSKSMSDTGKAASQLEAATKSVATAMDVLGRHDKAFQSESYKQLKSQLELYAEQEEKLQQAENWKRMFLEVSEEGEKVQEQYNKQLQKEEEIRKRIIESDEAWQKKRTFNDDRKSRQLEQEIANATMDKYNNEEHFRKQEMYEKLFADQVKAEDTWFTAFGKRISKHVRQVIEFRLVMTTFNKVINGVINTYQIAIKTAAEAEQVYAKLNTVFTSYTGSMEKAIELSNKLGTAVSTTASALSTIGDQLQAQGATTVDSLEIATKWAKDFADIIAFKDINMSLEEFTQNFIGGTAGNLRNFRSFGSIVKESAVQAKLAADGLDRLTGSELELAKVIARAEIALEQQKNAMGATEREWDTLLSVQRRYQESSKELYENVGELMKPAVKAWTEFKTGIIETLNAKIEYDKYMKEHNGTGPAIVTDASNKDLIEAFKPLLSGEAMKLLLEENKTAIMNAISFYGLSNDDFMDFFEKNYKGLDKKNKKTILDIILGEKDERTAAIQESNAISTELLTLAESVDSIVDAMGSIKGINLTSSWEQILSWWSDNDDASVMTNIINGDMQTQIKSAVRQLKNANPDDFVSISELVFGTDMNAGNKEILKSVEALYEVLYNRMVKYGDVSKETLDGVYDIWRGITDEMAEEERILNDVSKLMDKIGEHQSNALGFKNQAAQVGMDDFGKKMDDYARAIEKATGEMALESDGKNDLIRAIEQERDAFVALTNATREYQDVIDATARWDESDSKTFDLRKQLSQLGMDDFAIAMDDYAEEIRKAKEELGDDTLAEKLERQKEVYTELYNATRRLAENEDALARWNDADSGTASLNKQFERLGLDSFTVSLLDYDEKIKNAREELGDEDYAQKLERQKNAFVKLHDATEKLNETLSNIDSMMAGWEAVDAEASDYRKQISQLGMSDYEKSIEDFDEKIRKASDNMDTGLVESLENAKQAFIELTDATEKLRKEDEFYAMVEKSVNESVGRWNAADQGTVDYRKQLAQLGMDDYSKQIWDFEEQIKNAREELGDADLAEKIEKQKEAFIELTYYTNQMEEAERRRLSVENAWDDIKDNVMSNTGIIGNATSVFSDGEGDIWTDIITIILDIAESTEEWANLIAELDSVLEPFLIVVRYAIDVVAKWLAPVLEALLPAIKGIAIALAEVIGIIDIFVSAIVDGFKQIVGKTVSSIINMINGIVWLINKAFGWLGVDLNGVDTPKWVTEWANAQSNTNRAIEDMANTIEEIKGAAIKTAENTGNKDYAIYVDLYKRGLLSKDNFFTATGANKYSSSTTANGVTITSGSRANATYVQIHGLVLKVSDYEDFKEQMQQDLGLNLGYGQ